MPLKILALLLFPISLLAQQFSGKEIKHWEQQASHVTITRDNWGIPHIVGHTVPMQCLGYCMPNAKMTLKGWN